MPPDGSGEQLALWNTVTPGYFATLGIPLREGRDFDTRDTADGRPVMIVSRLFAEQMFPGESSVGKRVKSTRDENAYREVIGVAEEVRYWGLAERQPAPLVYVPWAQDIPFGGSIVARSRGDRAEAISRACVPRSWPSIRRWRSPISGPWRPRPPARS